MGLHETRIAIWNLLLLTIEDPEEGTLLVSLGTDEMLHRAVAMSPRTAAQTDTLATANALRVPQARVETTHLPLTLMQCLLTKTTSL